MGTNGYYLVGIRHKGMGSGVWRVAIADYLDNILEVTGAFIGDSDMATLLAKQPKEGFETADDVVTFVEFQTRPVAP